MEDIYIFLIVIILFFLVLLLLWGLTYKNSQPVTYTLMKAEIKPKRRFLFRAHKDEPSTYKKYNQK